MGSRRDRAAVPVRILFAAHLAGARMVPDEASPADPWDRVDSITIQMAAETCGWDGRHEASSSRAVYLWDEVERNRGAVFRALHDQRARKCRALSAPGHAVAGWKRALLDLRSLRRSGWPQASRWPGGVDHG